MFNEIEEVDWDTKGSFGNETKVQGVSVNVGRQRNRMVFSKSFIKEAKFADCKYVTIGVNEENHRLYFKFTKNNEGGSKMYTPEGLVYRITMPNKVNRLEWVYGDMKCYYNENMKCWYAQGQADSYLLHEEYLPKAAVEKPVAKPRKKPQSEIDEEFEQRKREQREGTNFEGLRNDYANAPNRDRAPDVIDVEIPYNAPKKVPPMVPITKDPPEPSFEDKSNYQYMLNYDNIMYDYNEFLLNMTIRNKLPRLAYASFAKYPIEKELLAIWRKKEDKFVRACESPAGKIELQYDEWNELVQAWTAYVDQHEKNQDSRTMECPF
jgi:hypothetical protein